MRRGSGLVWQRGGWAIATSLVAALAAGAAQAKPRQLRRLDGHAWVRSNDSLAGVELGYLAHLNGEVARLAPGYFDRSRLDRPDYIIDIAPARSRRSAGMVMAVGGRIVLHTTLGTVQRFERSALVSGLCRVWAMANRIVEDCSGFAPYFDLRSPIMFEEPVEHGAFLDVTVAGEEMVPLACLLTINGRQAVFAASDGLPVSAWNVPVGRNRFQVRCHRVVGGEVEAKLYEGTLDAQPARRAHVQLDWDGLQSEDRLSGR